MIKIARRAVSASPQAIDQRGGKLAAGTAVVQLVSREGDTIPPVLQLPEGYDPFRGLPG
jgi:hypothetical protein